MKIPRHWAFPLALLFSANSLLVAQDKVAILKKLDESKATILRKRSVPAYRDEIRRVSLAYERTISSCDKVELNFDSPDVRDEVLGLVEVNDQGKATAGSWRETVPGIACGQKRRYNVQVDITPKGYLFQPAVPGDAAGNPELQGDTLKNIETNLLVLGLSKKKGCPAGVLDTHLVGSPSTMQPNGVGSPWSENWEVQSCGKVYVVPVTFTPDGRGTRISIATTQIHSR